jgi:hypothetical protein
MLTYQIAKVSENSDFPKDGAYKKLILNGMNIDQIWEELQLQNNLLLGKERRKREN